MTSTFIIYGDVPSKKNSKRVFCRGRFPVVLCSEHYERWHKEAMKQIKEVKTADKVEEVVVTIYPKTKRAGDLTNKAESILDLLVDSKVIADDNWYVVPHVEILFGEVDKENPRAEITIIPV